MKVAASIEQKSEHPIAAAIITKAEEESIDLEEITNFEAIKGQGVKADINNETYYLVRPKYLDNEGIEYPKEEAKASATKVFLLKGKTLLGLFTLSDKIREESYEAIKTLQSRGIACWMLTVIMRKQPKRSLKS